LNQLVVALFLGVVLDEIDLENYGWGLVLGWTLWMFIIFLLLEILKILFASRRCKFKNFDFIEEQNLSSGFGF
jgi:hypothetical protein